MVKKTQILSLYRNLLRYGKSFHDHGIKKYTLRRIKEEFRLPITTTEDISIQYNNGIKQLNMIKRQSLLQNIYFDGKYINQQL